jgi:hypothetical protein
LDQLTSKQLSEWEAYDRLDPVGKWRDDFRLAYLSSLLTNLTVSVYGKKGAVMTNPIDFMLDWDVEGEGKQPKQQSVEEMKQILLGFARSQNRKVDNQIRSFKSGPHKRSEP